VKPVRALLENLEPAKLAEYLIGGILKADLHPMTARSLSWEHLRADDFVLPPLPNTLFQRDNTCWIYGGPLSTPWRKPARQRESLHTRAVYRYHPIFKDEKFDLLLDEEVVHHNATIEGGDVHVLGHKNGHDRHGRANDTRRGRDLDASSVETGQAVGSSPSNCRTATPSCT